MQLEFAECVRVFINRRLLGSASSQEAGSRRDLVLTGLAGGALLCLMAYCVLGAVMITVGSARLIPNQDENTYPESTIIYSAINAARSGHLYSSPSQPPYVLQPFGPLYYAINATVARAAHLDFALECRRYATHDSPRTSFPAADTALARFALSMWAGSLSVPNRFLALA